MNALNKFKDKMSSVGIQLAGKDGKPHNPKSKKVLCCCRGGCSRSVGLSNYLKYGCGMDSLAIGFEGNSPETLDMLCNWAEIIIVMREFFQQYIPERHKDKVRFIEVGEDVYFQPNVELYNKCAEWVKTQEDLRLG